MSLQFSDEAIATKFLAMCEDVADIKRSQEDTHKRLFGGDGETGALAYLHNEVCKVDDEVQNHAKSLTFYRGALAVLTFIWTAAVAVGAAMIGRHR